MMKAITYKGIYSPILKNNGCEVTIQCKKPGQICTFEQVIPYREFTKRQQKMLARNLIPPLRPTGRCDSQPKLFFIMDYQNIPENLSDVIRDAMLEEDFSIVEDQQLT